MAVWRGSKKLDSGKRQSHRRMTLSDIQQVQSHLDIKLEEEPPRKRPRARVIRLKFLPFSQREILNRERHMGWVPK